MKVLSVERDQNVSGYTTYTVEAEDDPIPYLIQVHRLVGGVRQVLLTQELRIRLAHADTFSQEAITRAILLVWRERLRGALNRALGEPVP